MTLQEFKNRINAEVKARPDLKEEILDLFQLAWCEIEDGASATHEMELCLNDIEELKK